LGAVRGVPTVLWVRLVRWCEVRSRTRGTRTSGTRTSGTTTAPRGTVRTARRTFRTARTLRTMRVYFAFARASSATMSQ
jgi:hypothetical protein